MYNKKSQHAFEFMIIFIFIMSILVLIMFISGRFLIEIQNNEKIKNADNYAEQINNELQTLSKVEPGYKRKLVLHSQNYKINIRTYGSNNIPADIKLTDIYSNKTYYFDLIGNYDLNNGNFKINYTNKIIGGINCTVLNFEKLSNDQSNMLDISQSN